MALRPPPPPPPPRGNAKLSREEVREIARHASDGVLLSDLAEIYGVSLTTIANIANGKTWGDVTGIAPRESSVRLTDSERGEIVRLRADGHSAAEIAVIMDRSDATVFRVLAHARASGL